MGCRSYITIFGIAPLPCGRRFFSPLCNTKFGISGKDGYLTFGDISKEGRVVDTYLGYAQSFVDYVKKVGTIKKLPLSEYSTQSFK